jgi:hypothetical protein
MHIHHIIPIRNKSDWFQQNRVFYFQLGKSKKTEGYIDEHYELIQKTAHKNHLNFIYHKFIQENQIDITEETSDYSFLREIANMDEKKFYDELAYLIFDYDVYDPIFIVRRYDENNLIGWVYHRSSVQDFPFVALESLDHITIGTNSPVRIEPISNSGTEITTPATHPESFFKAIYQCPGCNYIGEIYVQNDYDLFNIGTSDEACNFCKQEKELLSAGDLIYRKDWTGPDNDPWQMQCAYLPEDRGYCKECEPVHKADYRSLMPSCPKCEMDMIYLKSR